MKKISDDVLASMEFSASYRHNGIQHTDCYYGQRVNLWRDLLPPRIIQDLHGKQTGDQVVLEAGPGTLVAARDQRSIYQVQQRQITPLTPKVDPIQPRFGRFYPLGILNKVAGVYPNNMTPFRCVSANEDAIEADANHPLADKAITFKATIKDVREKFEEHGGTSIDWAETALSGPGMQARVNGSPTHFFADDPFRRKDESPDRRFYEQPRLVQHIDTTATDTISRLYGRLLQPESRVLDLMSSWVSHLPHGLPLKSVTGLGMNNEELQANDRLSDFCVHDLNDNPQLPFDDKAFDAAICTVSVEYLVHPFEVFEEINRVLTPGGVFVVTFSNRWFPPKAIHIWPELHEFERMGLVLEFFLKSGQYTDLHTYSMRGRPRPADDKYASQMLFSDPVYAVWGTTHPA
ncbi:MAG: methyltransferase domain-containing protein [Deltaproteobacteria bacterium]|jgi:SAM-dependent methyltransferase|nr:methyltransferase domain-containing protein [Deltaproteobacteria bacterium]